MQNAPHHPRKHSRPRSRFFAAALLVGLCMHTQAKDLAPTTAPAPAPATDAPATTSPATPTPSSQPTTSPAVKSISELINQLGDDDADQRDLAQKLLVDRGTVAVADLQKAADNNPDPEIRNRAAAALAQMKDLEENGPSLITLHVKDASPADVLGAISAQSHAVFVGVGTGMVPGPVQSLTVDADRKPFWEVMADVCTQMNVGPVMQLSTRNTIQLFPSPRNWMASSPHEIVGPYWINVAGLYRTRSIDLMGPPQVEDQFIIKIMVLPEPKLAVAKMSDLILKQAVDDAGNSLLSKGPFMLRNVQHTNHTAEAMLIYPIHPGKKIAILRGEITLMLEEGFQQFQQDDVLGTPKVIAPLPGCKVETTITRQGQDMYRVTLQCTRAGLSDDRWNAMLNHPGDISLEDADGHLLTGFPSSMQMNPAPVDGAQPSFTTSAIFSQNSVNAVGVGVGVGIGPLGVRRMIKTGDAKKLTWNVATLIRPVVLPVTFKDLPMP